MEVVIEANRTDVQIIESYNEAIERYGGLESLSSSILGGYSSLHARRKDVCTDLEKIESLANAGLSWVQEELDGTRRYAMRFIYYVGDKFDPQDFAKASGLRLDYTYTNPKNGQVATGFGYNSEGRERLAESQKQQDSLIQTPIAISRLRRNLEELRIANQVEGLSDAQIYQLATLLITNFGTGWKFDDVCAIDSNSNLMPSISLVGDQIAGFCVQEKDSAADFVEITELCVSPDFAGNGIGRILVSDALSNCSIRFRDCLPYGEFNMSNGACHIGAKCGGSNKGLIPLSVAVQRRYRNFDVRTFDLTS
jgi:ribosomal protein S18 acetylase RimI-like enzyme